MLWRFCYARSSLDRAREIEPAQLGSYHRSSLASSAAWPLFTGCTGLAAAPAAFLSRFKVFTLKTSKTCQLSLRPGLICSLCAPL